MYCAVMRNGTAVSPERTFTIGGVSFVDAPDGEAAFAIVSATTKDGASKALQSFQADGDFPLGWEVIRTGKDGLLDIKSAYVAGSKVKVEVTTANGPAVWTYIPSATNQSWQRVD